MYLKVINDELTRVRGAMLYLILYERIIKLSRRVDTHSSVNRLAPSLPINVSNFAIDLIAIRELNDFTRPSTPKDMYIFSLLADKNVIDGSERAENCTIY